MSEPRGLGRVGVSLCRAGRGGEGRLPAGRGGGRAPGALAGRRAQARQGGTTGPGLGICLTSLLIYQQEIMSKKIFPFLL